MASKATTSPPNVPAMSVTFQKHKSQSPPTAGTMNQAKPTVNKEPLTLEALPYVVHHTLLRYLDPASSASLAVACPAIYPHHRARHGSVLLTAFVDVWRAKGYVSGVVSLHQMLREWMGNEGVGLKFSWYNEMFVGPERWLELEEHRWSDGWESS